MSLVQILLWSFASSVSEFIHHVGRIGREGNTGSVCVFCNAHNKKIFQGFVKLAEENHIKFPPRFLLLLCFMYRDQGVYSRNR